MEQLPPFLRDTSVKLHLRSFGWLAYRSGWLWDTFAVGAVGYTSQPLYAPADRGGTDLLHPIQDPILVLGQARSTAL